MKSEHLVVPANKLIANGCHEHKKGKERDV